MGCMHKWTPTLAAHYPVNAFSPDSSILYTLCDNVLSAMDINTLARIYAVALPYFFPSAPLRMRVSPDGVYGLVYIQRWRTDPVDIADEAGFPLQVVLLSTGDVVQTIDIRALMPKCTDLGWSGDGRTFVLLSETSMKVFHDTRVLIKESALFR